MSKKVFAALFCFIAAAVLCAAPAKSIYEKNRLEIIQPVESGKLLLRPTFNSCGFYYGTDKVESPVLEFRKKGADEWKKALTPVHFFEDKNTTTGLVMNEYRGSIVKLDENTTYEIRFKDGDQVLAEGKFTTWKSNVPVAKTVYIDTENFKAPYVISAKGKPNGWIRYTTKNGKVLKNDTDKVTIAVRNAAYVLLDDMTIQGTENSRNIITIDKSKAVRVRNCDISKWGRVGVQRFDMLGQFYLFPNDGSKIDYKRLYRYRINYDAAIALNPGSSEIVVERCYIHDPYGRANSWYYSHPAGPQAIMCSKPDHSIVIRYNDFIGSDLHRFNDAVESAGNFHSNGGINRDADVYGNFMIFCNDDNIELDGGQQNVRCFWNHFEGALCGVSIQGCMVSPVYVFENIFDGLSAEFGESNASIKTNGNMGENSEAFIFNNTFVGHGQGFRFNKGLKTTLKNNVFSGMQYITNAKEKVKSVVEDNSAETAYEKFDGVDKVKSELKNSAHGNYAPVDVLPAGEIDNFCAADSVRGAIQNNGTPLPYRPIPVVLNRSRIVGVNVKNGVAKPATVKITATVGGKGFKSAYSIRKNDVFDWMEITPSKGVLKSGDKVTFTVKFIPEKMNERRFYRGVFSLRLANGFSRVVPVYVDTDFIQPFKLDKAGDKAIYVDAKPAKAYRAKTPARTVPVKATANALGKDGKVYVPSARNVFEYTFEIPEDGRYYVMIHGYTTKYSSSVLAAVDNDKMVRANLQAKKYMTWMQIAPGASMGDKNRYYDFKKGTHKLRIQGTHHLLYFDGIVVTDSPGSFEQR